MRNLILGLGVSMLIVVIISTYLYENQVPLTLPQINTSSEPEQTDPKPLQPIDDKMISYTLEEDSLHITYNYGQDWVEVPIESELLFNGEYNGNEQELIPDSYILTESRAAFLYMEGDESGVNKIIVKESLDQGETWEKIVITDIFMGLRFRKIDFLSDTFGYVIATGDRTMTQEYSVVYVTRDGGETWKATVDPPTTRLLAFGGFVNDTTGFLSYGTINPEEPEVYVTQDAGETWVNAVFNLPKKYESIFVQAEVPIKDGEHLSVLVNQGPNGDYRGGHIKGEFISEDNGLTWEFSREVEPDETK